LTPVARLGKESSSDDYLPNVELEKLNTGLAGFVQRLRAALGDDLISVVLFGSAARGSFDPAISDVNVMLVLRSVSVPILDQIAGAAEPARRDFLLSLLTVTEADLGDSAELFPTKFLDIQRNHRTLWGREVAVDLVVPRDRLERQARRQLVNLHLRLRQVYLESRTRPEQLDAMIRRSVATLLLNLGLLLELKLGRLCESPDSILAAAAEGGLDRAQLTKFVEFKHGRHPLAARELPAFYEAFMQQVQAVIRIVDAK
jgi:predicted nucleotidyltransferase